MINESQARKYCREDISKIAGYAEAVADTTQTYICHHRNAESFTGFRTADLKKMNMYYHRPANELEFVTRAKHRAIHNKGVGNPRFGKHLRDLYSPEEYERRKQKWTDNLVKFNKSRTGVPLTDKTKQKLSVNSSGRIWFTNGVINKFARICPEGFVKGRTMRKKHG